MDKWQEIRWSYEKLDQPRPEVQRIDGIRLEVFEQRTIAHHEAEYWSFHSDRSFHIALRDGARRTGRWRLKGRGHILTLRYADGTVEVYDVKEIDRERLVLNLDLGMEVRGIARLEFARQENTSSPTHRLVSKTEGRMSAELPRDRTTLALESNP